MARTSFPTDYIAIYINTHNQYTIRVYDSGRDNLASDITITHLHYFTDIVRQFPAWTIVKNAFDRGYPPLVFQNLKFYALYKQDEYDGSNGGTAILPAEPWMKIKNPFISDADKIITHAHSIAPTTFSSCVVPANDVVAVSGTTDQFQIQPITPMTIMNSNGHVIHIERIDVNTTERTAEFIHPKVDGDLHNFTANISWNDGTTDREVAGPLLHYDHLEDANLAHFSAGKEVTVILGHPVQRKAYTVNGATRTFKVFKRQAGSAPLQREISNVEVAVINGSEVVRNLPRDWYLFESAVPASTDPTSKLYSAEITAIRADNGFNLAIGSVVVAASVSPPPPDTPSDA